MIGLLQRVAFAKVVADGETVAAIDAGLLVLVGVRAGDGPHDAHRLCQRLLGYRVFPDAHGRMNRSLTEAGGGLLLVPQFTLAADTRKGRRASFAPAADPTAARRLFDDLVENARVRHTPMAAGRFGADMQVHSVNDGPVTFWLET